MTNSFDNSDCFSVSYDNSSIQIKIINAFNPHVLVKEHSKMGCKQTYFQVVEA